MSNVDRRKFLALIGAPAVAAALPLHLEKALAIPAHNRTGTIDDVEHIIFLMQENRSFDHYFGTLRGVRGFADPHPVTLPSGKSVWHQPNGAGELLPFRPDVRDLGKTFLPDPPHGWNDGHAMWNGGRFDQWVPNKGVQTMTHHVRDDIPYRFALADAFTIRDNYHCSVLGPTDPNRYHMWTGWVGNDGTAGGPVITNAEAGYDWSTYPERLERAGISWHVYQDSGVGLDAAGFWGFTDDPYIGNFGDNSLLYFHQYQNAQPGTPLADKAKVGTAIASQNRNPDALLTDFRADVQSGRLPQVSWIVAPEAYCKHPNWEPDFGAWYVSQVVDILAANPEVWSKMVMFVTYDEDGGFFDHLVESGEQLTDSWDFTSGYDLSVHGPNGFFRGFKGGAGGQEAGLAIQALYGPRHDEQQIVLKLENRGSAPVDVTVADRYSSRSTTLTLAPAGAKALQFSLERTRGWYDLAVTFQGDPEFEYRYAGHVENGKASISDPGMGGLI
jgi:phospholipase C